MVTALAGVRQQTPEWLEARRALVTASDLPILLGISPYKCEADLADEKRGLAPATESNLRMRIGLALEDLIAAEYTRVTGRQTRRFRTLVIHPQLEWAGASPDARALGERRLVQMKWTGSRSRFADGVPQDIEAQVCWEMGCTGYPVADVAVLVGGDDVLVFEQAFDAQLFDNLVVIAADFRRRLAEGGPFSRDTARIKRDYPADNGAEMVADGDLDLAARTLADTRARRKALEANETALEDVIKSRMGEFAAVRGSGWHATWKRTKDREETDWRSLADGLLRQLPETERTALVGIHSSARQGFRPFRLVIEKEDEA